MIFFPLSFYLCRSAHLPTSMNLSMFFAIKRKNGIRIVDMFRFGFMANKASHYYNTRDTFPSMCIYRNFEDIYWYNLMKMGKHNGDDWLLF